MHNKPLPPLEDVWMEPEVILDRVWLFLNHLTVDADTRYYFYCALELRFLSEVIFFQIVEKARESELKRSDMKLYRPKDYEGLLDKIAPNYLEEVARNQLGWNLKDSDIKYISTLYGRLGALLHLPKYPLLNEDQEEWKLNIEDTVLKAYSYLCGIIGYEP